MGRRRSAAKTEAARAKRKQGLISVRHRNTRKSFPGRAGLGPAGTRGGADLLDHYDAAIAAFGNRKRSRPVLFGATPVFWTVR